MATFTKGSQGGVCEAVASHLSSEKYFLSWKRLMMFLRRETPVLTN